MYHFFCKDPAPTEIYASWHSLALHDALPIYHATATGTPPFDPADPTQPGEPITPVPSTPDPSNPGTPGDPGVPTVVNVPADPSLSFAKTGVLSADGNTIE